MARRKILKAQDRRELFDIPADEDSLIRHYSLSASDRLEIDLRRREHNKLGFAVQLCVMRHPGRVLAAGEIPPRAMLKYVADQIGADPTAFTIYARREETRRDHIARLMIYLGVRSATAQDRRAGLLSAIEAAAMSDSGASIVNAIVATLRERGALLPVVEIIERLGKDYPKAKLRFVEADSKGMQCRIFFDSIHIAGKCYPELTKLLLKEIQSDL